MDDELKIYIVLGIIINIVLTLVFHFPFHQDWLIAFIYAALVTWAGIWIFEEST